MKSITTNKAPLAAGHYSQGVIFQNLVFISGQLPIDPLKKNNDIPDIEQQCRQVLTNMENILNAANSDLNKVLKVTVYITDISLWERVNKVYADYFGEHKPARCIVPVKELHFGFDIEMEAIAYV